MNNDTTATPGSDYETILNLIEGRELDKTQDHKITGLVNNIKELWLLAKMASSNRDGESKPRQSN